jgi:N4-gp56 family major capsid protein
VANAYTNTGSTSLGGTVGSAGLVQKAYDRLIEFALRSQPLVRQVADKTPARQSTPGSSVTLQRYVDLNQQTTSLTESVDPDAVALATPTYTTITLQEYGNAVLVTRALELFSLADVDPAVANIIAYNMADSVDTLAQNALSAGTNVLRPNARTSTSTVTSSDTFNSATARKAVAKLRSNKAIPRKGNLYWAGIHPEVALDLRAETGVGSWRQPHEYQSNDEIWAGEIGTYEGAFYVESPRMFQNKTGAAQSTWTTATSTSAASGATTIAVTASTSGSVSINVGDQISGTGIAANTTITAIDSTTLVWTLSAAVTSAGVTSGATITVTPVTKVFNTYFAGQQALAEAIAEEFHVVIGPVVDKLMRNRPLGWYGVGGWSVYRNESLYRVESTSSIDFM